MKLVSLELHLYKPLMHNGVRHVVVDEFPSITVIAGENGSGKSSLLRECTPYPACRTDYEKNGCKKITYTHNGCTYILTSDFSKTAGAHSFLRDGLELNESGTTEVQENLVETHFEYDSIVSKLVSGKFRICDMGKPERKSLIMSTYPSNLTFMLEYHKSISSKLRAIGNNIKMLSQRELSLKSQIISPSILGDYKKEREDLNKTISIIDTDVYTINKSIEQVTNMLANIPGNILQYTPDTFIGKMKSLRYRMQALLKAAPTLPNAEDVKATITILEAYKSSLEEKVKEDGKRAITIRDDIDKYEKYLTTDTEENIAECKRLIATQEEFIKNTVVDQSLPFLTRPELDSLNRNMDSLHESITSLAGGTTPYWSEDQYKNAEVQLTAMQQSLGMCNSNISRVTESLELLKMKRNKHAKYMWPTGCTRACQLRNSLADILKSIDTQIEANEAELKALTNERDTTVKDYEKLKTALQERCPERQIIDNLTKYLQSVSWASFVLNGHSLVEVLNQDISKIYNSITRIAVNAENALKVKEANEILTILNAKLVNLQNNSAPAEQIIRESLLKKESELNEIIESISKNKEEIIQIDKENYNNGVYENILQEAKRALSDYGVWKKSYSLQQEIKLYRGYIDLLMQSRMKIQTELRKLDSIITEQDSYLIRLNDEVLPELMKLQKQYDELAIIEAQLSPVKGLPHLYLSKYVNSILSLTNRFIARVWSYPMELQYVGDDGETFDFSFPVILNGNSTIKDVNLCSNGQKSIVNLCFSLAICIFRQYSLVYPITLDECSDGLSVTHASSLVMFLSAKKN